MNLEHRICKRVCCFINHNHWYVLTALFLIAVIGPVIGCQSTVSSLIEPDKQVNRSELAAEIAFLAQIAESRVSDLDRQDAIKQQLLDAAVLAGEGGAINIPGLLSVLSGAAGLAFGLDRNYRLKNAKDIETARKETA